MKRRYWAGILAVCLAVGLLIAVMAIRQPKHSDPNAPWKPLTPEQSVSPKFWADFYGAHPCEYLAHDIKYLSGLDMSKFDETAHQSVMIRQEVAQKQFDGRNCAATTTQPSPPGVTQ